MAALPKVQYQHYQSRKVAAKQAVVVAKAAHFDQLYVDLETSAITSAEVAVKMGKRKKMGKRWALTISPQWKPGSFSATEASPS